MCNNKVFAKPDGGLGGWVNTTDYVGDGEKGKREKGGEGREGGIRKLLVQRSQI